MGTEIAQNILRLSKHTDIMHEYTFCEIKWKDDAYMDGMYKGCDKVTSTGYRRKEETTHRKSAKNWIHIMYGNINISSRQSRNLFRKRWMMHEM
jgi:hypothetical protein